MQLRNVTVPGLAPELAARVAAAQTLGAADPGWAPPCASVWCLLERRAIRRPDQEYLVYYSAAGGRRAWTYRAFRDRVIRVAQYLGALGVQAGDRVATLLPGHADAVFLYFAAWMLGACAVPLDAAAAPGRQRFVLADAGARWCFALPEFAALLAGAGAAVIAVPEQGQVAEGGSPLPGISTERLHCGALLAYGSGVGAGALLTQYNLLAGARTAAEVTGIRPGERWLGVLPIDRVGASWGPCWPRFTPAAPAC